MDAHLHRDCLLNVLEISKDINQVRDIESLLDLVLLKSRRLTGADAGSIYLEKNGKLSFEYVQNETLTAKDRSNKKYLYFRHEIDIDRTSIAGYVAKERTLLNIEDVYRIGNRFPYTFNGAFDESAGYLTKSALTVPLLNQGQMVGVIQLINAQNHKGEIIPFSKDDEMMVSVLADQAAAAIEKTRMTREIILRMVQLAELRDPEETGGHVNRVGTYAIEIYQAWATRNHIPGNKCRRIMDILRLAAMLHDVGKVGIDDAILKKTTRLDDYEFDEIKRHTVYGARLFKKNETVSDWDEMAAEIALNHHEKWDGTGYPGPIEDIFARPRPFKPGKKMEEIPLTARIVALADVYDALISRRSYKESWPEERVLDYIINQKGKHFDPLLVDVFMEHYDVIKTVREKYPD